MWLPLVTKCQLLRWRWKLHVELFLLTSDMCEWRSNNEPLFSLSSRRINVSLSKLRGVLSFYLFFIKFGPYSFSYYLFCFESFFTWFFLILSLCIWFHLVFMSNFIIIFFIIIFFLFWILFIIDFFFQFLPSALD
jgi:hypothetical protein